MVIMPSNFKVIFFLLGVILTVSLIWQFSTSSYEDEFYENIPIEITSDTPIEVADLIDNTTDNISSNSFPSTFHLWSQKASRVNWSKPLAMCDSIFEIRFDNVSVQENETLNRAKTWRVPFPHSDQSISILLSDCDRFRDLINFSIEPSTEEVEFPLAYVMVAHRNAAQFLRLFRAIYQPQNVYCLTYDTKSNEDFKTAIRKLTSCFSENVILTPSPEAIFYGHSSILHSVMTCMDVLRNVSTPWRYVQVVSWNDFPLRTNLEMVKIFKILNGTQDCALERMIEGFYVWTHDANGAIRPLYKKTVTPDGITMYKGSYATSMSREFVDFLFDDPSSKKLYKWILNGTRCAEELYWTTIIHNLHLKAPGAFPGECLHFYALRGRLKPFLSRFQIWEWTVGPSCYGKMTHSSCVYGVRDVPHLITRPELIAHKLYEEFESAAGFCLEQWYWKKVSDMTDTLDYEYYENLPTVKYFQTKDKDNFIC